MPDVFGSSNTDVATLVAMEVAKLRERIKISEENQKKIDEEKAVIEKYNSILSNCYLVIDVLHPMIKDLQKYADDRRELSIKALNRALNFAAEIIPEAEPGARFVIEGDSAYIQTARGTRSNYAEGSGYKGIASTFCRSFVLSANKQRLQTLMLDEVLSKVSTENSVMMSRALPIISSQQQVFMIEQKKEVFGSIEDSIRYKFSKEGDYTVVTKDTE